jgi:hypothetical protein
VFSANINVDEWEKDIQQIQNDIEDHIQIDEKK